MAPEQLEGKDADARTDIFAFGAVVYEMLTGKKAFEGKSQASLIGAIMHAEPAAISASQPLTPPALDRIVKVCLAKEPDDRWQSARDLFHELQWVGRDPIQHRAHRTQAALAERADDRSDGGANRRGDGLRSLDAQAAAGSLAPACGTFFRQPAAERAVFESPRPRRCCLAGWHPCGVHGEPEIAPAQSRSARAVCRETTRTRPPRPPRPAEGVFLA